MAAKKRVETATSPAPKAKRTPVEFECALTEYLSLADKLVSDHNVPRPDGLGWRLVSHTTSVCTWHYGQYGSVLVTYAWEREVTQ